MSAPQERWPKAAEKFGGEGLSSPSFQHQRDRFMSTLESKSQDLFSPPSYTEATESCHIAGVTKVWTGAAE